MTPDYFLSALNAKLEEGCHKGLKAERMGAVASGWELLVACDTMLARQSLQQAVQDDVVRGHLISWAEGEVLVSVQGKGHRVADPALLVREGEIFFVSGRPGSPAGLSSGPTLASWFEELIGAPMPMELALGRLKEDLWGSANARGREVEGLPHVMRMGGRGSYDLVGFWGYGCNSYALYFTRESGEARMFLRLPWGGAYMEPERERPRLLASLGEANRLFEVAAEQRLPLFLNNNMGDWYFAPQSLDGFSHVAKPLWGLEEVRRYVDAREVND